jgi:hypothetical protein
MPSYEREFLPHVVRVAFFAVLWMLLWSFFLLGIVRPGAQLHGHGQHRAAAVAPAAVASVEQAEGDWP